MNAVASEMQVNQRLARLEAVQSVVLDISHRSALCRDLHVFFKDVHEAIGRIMCASSFYIALLDESAKGVRFVYRTDEKEASPDPAKVFQLHSEDESPTAWVIMRGERLCITID